MSIRKLLRKRLGRRVILVFIARCYVLPFVFIDIPGSFVKKSSQHSAFSSRQTLGNRAHTMRTVFPLLT